MFVADSHPERMQENVDSLGMLKKDLDDVGMAYATVPLIMQYNKRDLPAPLAMDDLDATLNERKAPVYGAVARDGIGVFETLSAVADLVTARSTT